MTTAGYIIIFESGNINCKGALEQALNLERMCFCSVFLF